MDAANGLVLLGGKERWRWDRAERKRESEN